MADVTVKKSKIDGKGVFAARGFKKREIVMKWDVSHLLSKEQAEKLPEEEKKYLYDIDGKFVLEQPPERYVNHSCEANTFVKGHCDVAKRDIKKGEEITADYSKDDTYFIKEAACNCGSKKCKGKIKAKKVAL